MENELIAKLIESSPWAAFGVAVVFLLRKEIGAMFQAGGREAKADALMHQMVKQFDDNLTLFDAAVKDTARIAHGIDELLTVQRAIHTELVRGKK